MVSFEPRHTAFCRGILPVTPKFQMNVRDPAKLQKGGRFLLRVNIEKTPDAEFYR